MFEKNVDIGLKMMVKMIDKAEKSFQKIKKVFEQHKLSFNLIYRSLFYKVS